MIDNSQDILDLHQRLQILESRFGNMPYEMKSVLVGTLTSNGNVVHKSQTMFGVYTALCIDTKDIWKQNRVRFYSPILHRQNMPYDQLPWATAVSSMGGFDDCGLTWVPPAGSTLVIMYQNGNRECPYYFGTVWHRNRGPDGNHNWNFDFPEYKEIYEGRRKGYLVGPDDGSQVFPPWNTENYNGYDLTSILDFANSPEAQRLLTYPNIYGFKTPEKHMIKMVDGDPKCNRKWKRFEIMSSCGNWIMMKDDHLHYAGQWAHPECKAEKVIKDGEVSCYENADTQSLQDLAKSYGLSGSGAGNTLAGDAGEAEALSAALNNVTDITPKQGKKKEETDCNGKKSNRKIIGGHPNTSHPRSKYSMSDEGKRTQVGANPFFKHRQECRPYRGAPTPQNNVCDLPQSGIQIMSISGHTFVMDDSVEEPFGEPLWTREFDFGCNNHYVGRTYWKSATGHSIEMSDVESPEGDQGENLRGDQNYIRIKTATGNKIELNDHTESKPKCPGCPPNIAGKERGIHLQSTSNHTIDLVDEGNEQCSPCRTEGAAPIPKAKNAYIRIRTGYGLYMKMSDDNSQEETQKQSIQIEAPQKDNIKRGPIYIRFQEKPTGPGYLFLRVGGNYICQTVDTHYTLVGDEERNPADLVEVVSKQNIVVTKQEYVNVTDKSHIFLAKEQILLLAGRDAGTSEKSEDCSKGCGTEYPNIGAVLVYDFCTGCIRISDRVFASTSGKAPPVSIFQLKPFAKQCTTC